MTRNPIPPSWIIKNQTKELKIIMMGETIHILISRMIFFLNHKIELVNVIENRQTNSLNNPPSLPLCNDK